MIDVEEIKRKIILILRGNGPSLPMNISRKVGIEHVFVSAILSELLNQKSIKTSKLRIGSSPLYFIPGDEEKLENYTDNLTGTEKEAFLLLKEKKILQDESQIPKIRVALRSISDFAKPIKFQDKFYWKYFSLINEDIQEFLTKKQNKVLNIEPIEKKVEIDNQEMAKVKPENPLMKNSLVISDKNPIVKLKPKKIQKTAKEFLEEVKQILLGKDIEFLEEIEIDKKQIIAKARINSDIGKIYLMVVAKDKKRPSLLDLTMAHQKALYNKMFCYFLARGKPAKTANEFIEDNKNLLMVEIIE